MHVEILLWSLPALAKLTHAATTVTHPSNIIIIHLVKAEDAFG